ncbi:MAG: hypothetical protein ACYC63_16680 [Armatimonadota bacterium]
MSNHAWGIELGDDVASAIAELGLDIEDDVRDVYPEPDEKAGANECYEIYRWALADGRSLFVDLAYGGVESAEVADATIRDIVLGWDHDDYPETAEWLAAWGFNGLDILPVAEPGYDGPCRVWCEPNYYIGTYGAPDPGFVRIDVDDDGYCHDNYDNIREFETRAEAQAYVDEYYNAPSGYDGIPACNVLSHGQAGADGLTIVRGARRR